MGIFSAPKQPQAQTPAAVASLQVQQSVYGAAIPVVYGTTRITGNLIWYGDFRATPHYAQSAGGGGKGGGGSKNGQITGYSYSVSVLVGLGHGPVNGIGSVWSGKSKGVFASLGAATVCGVRLPAGSSGTWLDQPGWGFLNSSHPAQALAYSGIAAIGIADYSLGDQASLPNLSFEMRGIDCGAAAVVFRPDGDAGKNAPPLSGGAAGTAAQASADLSQPFDVWPDAVITDLLTSTAYGAGFPADRLADQTAFRSWCQAQGLAVSDALTTANAVRDVIQTYLTVTQTAAVWSNGRLKFLPLADDGMTSDFGSYSPDLTPLFDIDDSLMLEQNGEPPLVVSRKDPVDTYNRMTLEYADRSKDYNTVSITQEDLGHIDHYGVRVGDVVSAHFITCGKVADQVLHRLLARSVAVTTSYEWLMGPLAAVLEPMDIVSLTDPQQGLQQHPVRITEITEEDDSSFRIKAEDLSGSTATGADRPLTSLRGYVHDLAVVPETTEPPLWFEPPLALSSSGGLEVWLGACSLDPVWGGCTVWASNDGSGYRRFGTVSGPARMGSMMADLSASAVNGLVVQLADPRQQLLSVSSLDVQRLDSLFWLDGELLAYQSATLLGPGLYRLDGLVRGAYGSPVTLHKAGARFLRVDQSLTKLPFANDRIGQALQVKLTAFNIWGGGEQELSDVEPVTIVPTGQALTESPANVTGLTLSWVGGLMQLSWQPVSDPRPVSYEIRQGASWGAATLVAVTPVARQVVPGPGTYWVAARVDIDAIGSLYSPAPVMLVSGGQQPVVNVVALWSEQATGWSGTASGLSLTSGELFGSAGGAGSYALPLSHRIDAGRVALCGVQLSASVRGQSVSDNILTTADLFAVSDLLGVGWGVAVQTRLQLRTSADAISWSDWADWAPGAVLARYFDARALLSSADPAIIPVLSDLILSVDVPDRTDSFISQLIPAGGTTISFAPPFLGGPNGHAVPSVQVTLVNASPGDDVILTAQTLSSVTLKIVNGATDVARSVNLLVQGY